MEFGAVILCGGKSSRMGTNKANLTMGAQTFLEHLLSELSNFDEILISVGSRETLCPADYHVVVDQYRNCGPMGGLHAALQVCKSDALLVLACDLPLFRREVGTELIRKLAGPVDAAVPITTDGRIHPLCAVYRKSAAQRFEQFLCAGNYKMRDALHTFPVNYFPVEDIPWGETALRNVNTPFDYSALFMPGERALNMLP